MLVAGETVLAAVQKWSKGRGSSPKENIKTCGISGPDATLLPARVRLRGDVGWYPSTHGHTMFLGMTVLPLVLWKDEPRPLLRGIKET
jgi:hypothetical protein